MVEEPKTPAAQRILEAASELFGELGYEGTSLRAVAERAGVAKGLAFHHFGTKAHLLELVLQRFYEGQREALAPALMQDAPPEKRLHDLVDAYFDFSKEHYRFPRLIQTMTARDATALEIVQRQYQPMFQFTLPLIEELAPKEGPMSSRQFYLTFTGAVLNYFGYADIVRPAIGVDPLSPEGLEERRQHLHFILDGLIAHLKKHHEAG